MNIGTISVNINTPDFNYGAILHSWAFLKYLNTLPYVESVEVIDYLAPHLTRAELVFPPLKPLKNKYLRTTLRRLVEYPEYRKRYHKFRSFTEKNICTSAEKYDSISLNIAKLPYDTVICESDVIWSPQLVKKFDKAFFAAMDSMKFKKRIAYSPSMGDINFSEEEFKEFGELIQNIDYISCRESYAVPVIEKYTDKPVTHVLDPVMLLDASDYDNITAGRIIPEDYVLLYLPVNDNAALREQAMEYARSKGLRVLEITTKLKETKDPDVTTLTSAGVEEFLSAVRNSTTIFTNSFHAVCFSVIFKKDFYAFTRKYSGKVTDICRTMGLEDRYCYEDSFKELPPIDWDVVYSIWNERKALSKNWIENALKD